MGYILPKRIQKGDTIGIIAPSGAIENKENVMRGVRFLEELGYKVKLSEYIFDKKRYLAGEDEVRTRELEKFFEDSEVDCILCARGGYGAIRILDKIDYELIKVNPKAFCGYSDVTALSVMLLKKAGLITYSAPMLCGDFGVENISEFTIKNFFEVIGSATVEFQVSGNSLEKAEGIAWGGNLTTLTSLCGRDFIPDGEFIFFVEDVNEPIYKIDRMLNQLKTLPEFCAKIKGVVLGDFTELDDKEMLQEVFEEFVMELKIPLWQGLKWGHEHDKATIPIGGGCLIENNKIVFP